MKAIKRLAIALAAYLGIIIAFESLVGFMGRRQAENGVGPGEDWIVLTTSDRDGSTKDTVVAGWESDGKLYVAANHWPRAWYERALAIPDLEVTRSGERKAVRAVPIEGDERDRLTREYALPLAIRVLTGFPPRAFLRLDPR